MKNSEEIHDMQCHCLIRHALTEGDRKEAVELLKRSRELGDTMGIIIAGASLGTCPSSQN